MKPALCLIIHPMKSFSHAFRRFGDPARVFPGFIMIFSVGFHPASRGTTVGSPLRGSVMSVLAGREILRRFQAELAALITNVTTKPTAQLESLTRDLRVTGRHTL